MSKTTKIILVVIILAIVIFICLCGIIGGVIAVRTILNNTTPAADTSLPREMTAVQIATAVPPAGLATAVPPAVENTPVPQPTPTATAFPPDQTFTLDGVDLKVVEVRYSLINGGEDGAGFIDAKDGFLLVVAFSSSEMDLGFIYDNYRPTTRLVDTGSSQTYEPNWNNWSLSDSPTNSGYYMVSFPMREAPKSAVFYFNDAIAIDLTPVLPQMGNLKDPWLKAGQKFEVSGMDLRLQSATLVAKYTALDGTLVEKTDPENKLLVVRFTSTFGDLVGASEWNPVLTDRNDFANIIYYSYMTWSTDQDANQGKMEYIYEIPPERKELIIYLPYENLINLTDMITSK